MLYVLYVDVAKVDLVVLLQVFYLDIGSLMRDLNVTDVAAGFVLIING